MNTHEARRWMEHAEKDLRAARVLLSGAEFFPRQSFFLAQQCAVKSIKAILVFEGVDFSPIKHIPGLYHSIPKGWKIKETFPDLAELTVWSVESRYPGTTPDVVEYEARETLLLAEAVYDAVKEELEEHMK